MNEPRQRAHPAVATGAAFLGVLILAGGCQMSPTVDAAQTAVAAAQTAVPGFQTALPGFQTALPGLQATAQAGATLVGAVLADPQGITSQLQVVLSGVAVTARTTPEGAANDAVTEVRVSGTDARGTFAQTDPAARQAMATAALLVLAQYYPNASITLAIVDSSGGSLVSGNTSPGKAPVVQ